MNWILKQISTIISYYGNNSKVESAKITRISSLKLGDLSSGWNGSIPKIHSQVICKIMSEEKREEGGN